MRKITFDFSGSETQRPEIKIEARIADFIFSNTLRTWDAFVNYRHRNSFILIGIENYFT